MTRTALAFLCGVGTAWPGSGRTVGWMSWPSGAIRVRVYAGIDPVTKRRHYLTEVVPGS